LSNVLVPSDFLTVLVTAASKHDAAKLGFPCPQVQASEGAIPSASADGNIEEMQSSAAGDTRARRHHGHDVHDARPYLYVVPLRSLRAPRGAVVLVRTVVVSAHIPAVPCPRSSSVCDHHGRRSRLFSHFSACHSIVIISSSAVVIISPVSACPAPGLLLAGLWGRSATPGLRCVCGDLRRRDDCGRYLRHRSRGTS
jgi:hypothetical protein